MIRKRLGSVLLRRSYSELISRVQNPGNSLKSAIVDCTPGKHEIGGKITTYEQLYTHSKRLAIHLKKNNDLSAVTSIAAFISHPDSDYVVTMLATWILGKTFVPLCPSHPIKEISYFIEDSKSSIVIHNIQDSSFDKYSVSQINDPKVKVINISSVYKSIIPDREYVETFIGESTVPGDRIATENALVLYTSGTTGKPKGVLHTHTGLRYMMEGLVKSWKYTDNDVILHFLPLHHLHGVLNKLLCMLYAGGTVKFLEFASAASIWHALASFSNSTDSSLHRMPTLFMAVPTVYSKLLESEKTLSEDIKKPALEVLKKMRLHVSGSAALPDVIMDSWRTLTGHTLLERYGMTELGMVLSNPYEKARIKGYVGFPLPSVEVRIVDDNEKEVTDVEIPGELRVKGPTVFKEYLNRPEVTLESFDKEGWFRTGDIAVVNSDGYYRLLGRNSTDIIKRAGYKLSALEIEREILSHPEILEAAVIGIPDETLGESVVAVITLRPGPTSFTSSNARDTLNAFLEDKLAHYKRPRFVSIVNSIPRNHMGKVNKKTLAKDLNLVFGK